MRQPKNVNQNEGQAGQAVSPIDRESIEVDLLHASIRSGPWSMEFGEDGEITSCVWTDTFRQMVGYENEEDFPNVLESWSDLLHEEDKPYVMQEFWGAVRDCTGVKAYDVEYRMQTREKGWRWFHAAGRLTRRENGTPIAIFGLFIDIDDRKRMEERLQRQTVQLQEALAAAQSANRVKTDFLNNISHDIRTPLNAVIGFTNLALESGDAEVQREYLENVAVSSKHLLSLINSILDLSKTERQRDETEEELVNIDKTFHELVMMFSIDLKKKRLTHTVDLDIQHTYLYVDTLHHSQVFLNIISNAVKFTPMGGRIAVFCKELPGDTPDTCIMETVIQDNGIGMSSEFLAHAYESFSRERTSTASGLQGTGLGLTIVKNLVGLMNGTVEIESQLEQGTKVTVRLPHRLGSPSRAEEAVRIAEIDYSVLKGRRILLTEDIDINAIIATKLLTDKGCTVERARDGVECVDMVLGADAGYYDLVLMDIQMPNMDGYGATRAIRAAEDRAKAGIPILAMTANAFQEDFDKAIEAGMDGYIAKPLDTAFMFRMIIETLRKK